MTVSYNISRHSNEERLNPPKYHSRYVHLKLLLKNVKNNIEKHVKNNGTSENVFADMGCGNLPYKPLIEPYVTTYAAVDLPGNSLATNFVDTNTNRTDLKDNSCDIVWSIAVLEHVSDPEKYLKECHRIMKPNGKLILCTHGQWMFHPDPIDYGRWTSQGLKILIEKEGFKILEFYGMMSFLATSLQLFQDACLVQLPIPKFFHATFTFVMQRLIGFAERLVNLSNTAKEYNNKDACLFFVIATKK